MGIKQVGTFIIGPLMWITMLSLRHCVRRIKKKLNIFYIFKGENPSRNMEFWRHFTKFWPALVCSIILIFSLPPPHPGEK